MLRRSTRCISFKVGSFAISPLSNHPFASCDLKCCGWLNRTAGVRRALFCFPSDFKLACAVLLHLNEGRQPRRNGLHIYRFYT